MNSLLFVEKASEDIYILISKEFDEFKNEMIVVNDETPTKEAINETFEKLGRLVSDICLRNLDKFKIYSSRNIYNDSDESANINPADDELLQLRAQFQSLHNELAILQDNARAAELVLKDMRAARFNLRIGSQAFDDQNVQPLADNVASMTAYKDALTKLYHEAEDLTNKLNTASGGADLNNANNQSVAIITGDSSDISLVAQNLRSKKN